MSETYELVKFVDGSFELEVNVSPEEDTVYGPALANPTEAALANH